jgi:hypothetical protein
VVAGALAAGAALALAASASADPDEPPPGPAAPPPATIGGTVAQIRQAGPEGLLNGFTASPDQLVGQAAVPSAPGAPAASMPPLNALNNAYLFPQNLTPSAPGEGTPQFGVAPGDENSDVGRLDYLKRLHAMYRAGDLTGTLLGQRPQEQLGEPLPGTAPPPGTWSPTGLGQGTPDQAPAEVPGVPPPPG